MAYYLIQWKFTSSAIANLKNHAHDRKHTSISLAKAFEGELIAMYNRNSAQYDGVGIFEFPNNVAAAAHSIFALSTGSFEKHDCELLLSTKEYEEALKLAARPNIKYRAPLE